MTLIPTKWNTIELFANIVEGGEPLADAENGAMSTMTSLLGRMVTYSGKEITWDEALNSEISLAPQQYAFDANPPVMPVEGHYPVPVPGKTKVV